MCWGGVCVFEVAPTALNYDGLCVTCFRPPPQPVRNPDCPPGCAAVAALVAFTPDTQFVVS